MQAAATLPNFDAMTEDELMAFWAAHQQGRGARDLFPSGGKGTRTTTGQLANYAANKATAMTCRQRGDIQAASVYEAICDRIYEALPRDVQW